MEPKPSIGRIVHVKNFHLADGRLCAIPQAAIITHVWGDDCINATIFPSMEQVCFGSSVVKERDGYTGVTWDWPARV